MTTFQPAPTATDTDAATGAANETPLTTGRLLSAKAAYTTRFVRAQVETDASGYALLTGHQVAPRPGDVVLARIEEIGKHTKLESPTSRRQTLYVGDEVLVAYGHRYAPDQFEATVPDDLGPADLIAAGGIAGVVTAQHASVGPATRLQPLGLLARDGQRVTLGGAAPKQVASVAHAAAAPVADPAHPAPVVMVVLGTSMNSGKSTTLASLVHGLATSGLSVAAGKATGTGAGGDPRMFTDAGASRVLDFTDFGFASTYRLAHDRVRALWSSMVCELSLDGPDVVVIEIADGVYQQETARLLTDPAFASVVNHVVFAAADALGAVAGVQVLTDYDLPVLAVSGVVTASPLAAAEAGAVLDVPVLDTFSLAEASVARELLA